MPASGAASASGAPSPAGPGGLIRAGRIGDGALGGGWVQCAGVSLDWFAIFDDCVVLIEVKSTRPSEPVRLAGDNVAKVLEGVLGKAVQQLNKSAALVRNRHPAVTAVPADRPLFGLVVTMEPFHTVNTPFTANYLPTCDIEYRICSALELEHLVTVSDVSLGRLIRDHLTDPEKTGWSVRSALSGHARGQNAVLDAAWATYPWKDQPATTSHGPPAASEANA